MSFNLLDDGPTMIGLFMENGGLESKLFQESSHRLTSSLVMAVDNKYSI